MAIIPILGLVQRLDFASTSIEHRVVALTPRLTLTSLVGEGVRVVGVELSYVNIEQPTGVEGQHNS